MKEVELFYQVNGGGYTSWGIHTTPFSFTAAGDGYYEFYTIATDNVDNVEGSPFPTPDAFTTVNTASPGVVSGFTATRGAELVTLGWTVPADPDFDEVEVWRAVWHTTEPLTSAYPEYDDITSGTAPTWPADHDDVLIQPEWEHLTGITRIVDPIDPFTFTFTDIPPVRGVYYYVIYAKDTGGLYGVGAQASAFSYVLGDMDGDGDIDAAATSRSWALPTVLSRRTRSRIPTTTNCDVGPTDDFSGSGFPDTDNYIDFEDLMIFALNWDIPVAKAPLTEGSLIARFSWVEIDDTTWSLVLAEPCANLKGVNLKANLPQDGVLSVTAGDLLKQQDYSYFLQNIPRNGLDAGLALLGTDACITGQGELVRIELAEGIRPERPRDHGPRRGQQGPRVHPRGSRPRCRYTDQVHGLGQLPQPLQSHDEDRLRAARNSARAIWRSSASTVAGSRP